MSLSITVGSVTLQVNKVTDVLERQLISIDRAFEFNKINRILKPKLELLNGNVVLTIDLDTRGQLTRTFEEFGGAYTFKLCDELAMEYISTIKTEVRAFTKRKRTMAKIVQQNLVRVLSEFEASHGLIDQSISDSRQSHKIELAYL